MDNLLSRFALDYWYQVLMAVCIAVFLLNGAGLLHVLPTVPTTIISLGGFFVGFGEFINHPLQTELVSSSASHSPGIRTGHPRKNSPLGIASVLFGLVLVGVGIFVLYKLILAGKAMYW